MPIQIAVVTQIDWERNYQKVRAVLDHENMVNLAIEPIHKYREFPVKAPCFSLGEIILSEDKISEMNGRKRDILVDFIILEWFDNLNDAVARSVNL